MVLMYLTLAISIEKHVWHNLHNFINRCVLWETSRRYFKSDQFSEHRILSHIDICASLLDWTYRWQSSNIISSFWNFMANFSHLYLKICINVLLMSLKSLMNNLNVSHLNVSILLSNSLSKKDVLF